MYDLSHLEQPGKREAVQQEEALFLYSLVKVLRPRTIVEFGFAAGYSARNFLAAMPEDCHLYSYDPSPDAFKFAGKIKDERFTFYQKRGEDFMPSDIEGRPIEIAFLDASHVFEHNKKVFEKIKGYLSDACIIIVHDTGLYNKDFMEVEWRIPGSFYVTDKGYAHRPQERIFVNYLKRRYPQFGQIHLHSMNVGRMGLTVIQRYKKLDVGKLELPILAWRFVRPMLPVKILELMRNLVSAKTGN
ncbi:MAG: class I SAM-dependent methyltransferase [Thermodesulfobacteriota bacterium]|nr:class I SAM-dependent methyltransferase [Thermodesulfobacteriota bacterium]